MNSKFYVTTPIYYVNDKPHIGHLYTTTMADILARYHRLFKEDVFFLTGTDEHAAKVVEAAKERGLTPLQWADQNAAAFAETFQKFFITNNDFVRTTQERHQKKVQDYVAKLMQTGDVFSGEYEGWYDAGQEEYVTDNKAKDYDYKSPINGKPLLRKKERNYFFRLSKYAPKLLELLEKRNEFDVQPEARRNETINRIKEGLNDVPISRSGTGGWGIPIPGDPDQNVYVWIDALFNYLSIVDTPQRRHYWPADVHLIAKDILWFHAVIWPAMLLALEEPLPRVVYSHSFWTSEGQKMSKSLGNFIDLDKIEDYAWRFGVDALRWFLATNGPFETMDSDFSENKFIGVYNSDLANDYGNLLNRISGLIGKYFNGEVPEYDTASPFGQVIKETISEMVERIPKKINNLELQEALVEMMRKVGLLNSQLEFQAPWQQMKQDPKLAATTLYVVAEGLRLCTVLLQPVMPEKTKIVLEVLGAAGTGTKWGELKSGTKLKTHGPLFPRFEMEKQ